MKAQYLNGRVSTSPMWFAVGKRKPQQGITLVEVSIVLLITAILAAVVFAAFQNNARRQEIRENIVSISTQIMEAKQKFGRPFAFENLDTNLALSSGMIESVNSYGGPVCISGATAASANGGFDACGSPVNVGSPDDVAVLQWHQVPVEQCIDLVISTLDGARSLYVDTTVVRLDVVNVLPALEGACAPLGLDFVKISWVIAQR